MRTDMPILQELELEAFGECLACYVGVETEVLLIVQPALLTAEHLSSPRITFPEWVKYMIHKELSQVRAFLEVKSEAS